MTDKATAYALTKLLHENIEPTLDECIKEWEEKGWKLRNIDVGLQFYKYSISNQATINFYVKDYNGRPTYRASLFYIDYELSCLISKTLKALE